MENYLKNLNKDQYEAVTHPNGPLLIIAGAGSGKTHTLIHRVAYLIENGTDPNNILLLTFTNKAANELKERASKVLDERCDNIYAGTFHSFCAYMLRKYAKYTDYTEKFTIITPPEANDAIGLAKASEDTYSNLKNFPSDKVLSSIFSYAVNKCISIEDVLKEERYSNYKQFRPEIEALQNAYSVYKIEHNMMDYDDLLVVFLRLLERCENVRTRIESQFTHILVDEYQDTNTLQEKILFALRRDNKNITVVGDDAQSIYAFRGAEVNNIITFPERMPGCKVVSIKINYRSTKEIVKFSNDIYNANSTVGFKKEMVGTYTQNSMPAIIRPYNMMQEADVAYSQIQEWLNDGIRQSDIAVLARSSNHLYQLESRLSMSNIQYVKYGGLKFLEHACVVDMLALLRCLTNPFDQLAWFRVLKLIPGIGDKYAQRISENCENRMFLIDPIWHKHSFSSSENAIAKWEHDKTILMTLKDIALQYPSVIKFLDDITLDSTKDDKKEDSDPIILSTIHSAKGLEFKCVIVMDCMDGYFPKTIAEDYGTKDDNEELRCFYVAMTRAKEQLVISAPLNGYKKGYTTELTHFIRKMLNESCIA